jgi:hypothetical protein
VVDVDLVDKFVDEIVENCESWTAEGWNAFPCARYFRAQSVLCEGVIVNDDERTAWLYSHQGQWQHTPIGQAIWHRAPFRVVVAAGSGNYSRRSV